ncbi:transmembrane protein 6/97 [Tirmania nivea]|nr:transmembrane protein 6/97 [Tirmania nivea]
MPQPLSARPWDRLYFYFFMHMVPIMLFVDSAPYIPTALQPAPMAHMHAVYDHTFNDPLQRAQPTWYYLFAMAEFAVQLPLGVWALRALPRDDPLLPLGLGVYAVLAAFTTWVCVGELLMWDEAAFAWESKCRLVPLYAAYGVVFTGMAIHMGCRIKRRLLAAAEMEGGRKGK